MQPTNRRHLLTTGFLGAAGLALGRNRLTTSALAQDSATPPETCLAIETFPVPAGERPHDVAPAADGRRVWYTAQHAGALGLLDPETGEIETVPLGDGSAPHGVIVDAGGAAWVTDGGLNAMVRVDADSGDLAVYPLAGPYANLNTAAVDSDGVVWFTGQAGIVGRVDPARHQPGDPPDVAEAPRGVGPYGIAVTPGGDVYFASLAGSYLGRILPEGDSFTAVVLDPPTPDQGTRRVWSDSQGVLWTSQWNAGQVAGYDPATGAWREWRLPGDAPQAYAVYVDERDDVWLSDFSANTLVRFDPDTETFASLPLPGSNASLRQIHGRPDEVWAPASSLDQLLVVRCQ
jgi:virginiamycin B lyase